MSLTLVKDHSIVCPPVLETALMRSPLEEAVLTREVALQSTELDLGYRDPVHHVLAATALVHGLRLVTLDEWLRDAGWLPTRSDQAAAAARWSHRRLPDIVAGGSVSSQA